MPNDPEPFFNKGNVFWRQKQYEDAILWYDKALQRFAGHSKSWNNKGICLAVLRRFEEALQCYDKAVSCSDPEFPGWSNKARVQEDIGSVQDAIASYEGFLQVASPDSKQVEHARERINALRARTQESRH